MSKAKFRVAVVGSTGVVGREMIHMLESRHFPVESLRLMASEKSKGKSIRFRGRAIPVEVLRPEAIENIDVALFSAGATISKQFAPIFTSRGAYVIDNSSAWRMDKSVPLVVPEVNSHELKPGKKLIANPNCSTIQMVVALQPIHKISTIQSIHVATYQAVSGAGSLGITDLEGQSRAWAKSKTMPSPKKIVHQIAFNVVPQIDVFSDDDYTKEELKMTNETQKIMGSKAIKVSATCVRVPVFRSHSEAVWIKTKKPLSPTRARQLLNKAPGVVLVDEPEKQRYPMPIHAAHQAKTFVGRIRKDLAVSNGLLLWIVSDNLLKGAALNAVEIAEELIQRRLLS